MDFYLDPEIPPAERRRLQGLLREAFANPKRAEKLEETKALLRQLGGTEDDLTDVVCEQAAQRVENWRQGGVHATAEDVAEIVDAIFDSLLKSRQQTVAAAEKQQAVAQAQAPSVKPSKPAVKLPQQPAALDSQRRALEARIKAAAPEAARQFLSTGRAAIGLSNLRELRT